VTEVAIAAAPLYPRLMTDVKSNVGKKFGIGVVVLALAGAVGAGLIEGVKEAAKSTFRQTISWGQEQVEQLFPSALPQADKNAAFSIFIAKLDGDPDGSQTKLVRESLRRSFDATDAQHRIEVREIGRVLREGTTGDVLLDHQKAQETGKEWLKQSGAHVLIWGYVADRNKALRIFFVAGEGTVETRPRETYTLTERFQLSEDFGEDLGLVIAVRAVASLSKFRNLLLSPSDYSYYQRFKAIAGQKLISQTKAGCQLRAALGELLLCSSFDITWFLPGAGSRQPSASMASSMVETIEILQGILGDSRCADDSELVAQVYDLLGFAFLTLGKDESGTARLEQAVTAYRGALDVFARVGTSNYARLNIENARRNLADAETLLAERRGKGF
jgi:hypothetical protein